jgi:DNA polymerase-3 subunit gamma/tau
MQNQVLYRKYRPSEWKEVVGQEHIVSVLEQSTKAKNFSHAYLFTGSRGTGKTSVARIFARALGTSDEDIIEIDAASNRGIDDIRALREAVRTMPFSSVFKVYIIDEVHMLTKEAFNALLKSLEEPPEHVIFILATTELDKVPETILSRCQVFTFRKPNEATLIETVQVIAKSEKKRIDDDAAALIAFLGDGSFRDTLSILQKVFSAGEDAITRELVERITGSPSLSLVKTVFEGFIARDIDTLFTTLRAAETNHTDAMLLAELLLSTMRLSLLYRYSAKEREALAHNHSEQYLSVIKLGAEKGEGVINSQSLLSLITAIERISYAAIPMLPLEIAFLDILRLESPKS